MYGMKMLPVFKDYLWGGELLVSRYEKKTDLRPVAESWELSCHPDGLSTVSNGEFSGRTLLSVLKENPQFMGAAGDSADFPIIIKLIDAKQQLSLQVHPNDEYGLRRENQHGKNEMWYVIDCVSGAKLTVGCRTPLTAEKLADSIRDGSIMDAVNQIAVSPGDCFLIPAGMLHGIGEGILIAEIQQSSNLTYRVYDYDRVGADGKKRPLHIEKAIEVTDTSLKAESCATGPLVAYEGFSAKELAAWDFFKARYVNVESHAFLDCDKSSFQALLVLLGSLNFNCGAQSLFLSAGETVFIPAGLGAYKLEGCAEVLISWM